MTPQPVVAFLFFTGDSQADASLGLGTYGSIEYNSEDGWKVDVIGDTAKSMQLTEEVRSRFSLSENPEGDLWGVKEYLYSCDSRIKTHGSLENYNAGFLLTEHIAGLLEGTETRVFTLSEMEAYENRRNEIDIPRAQFVLCSDRY